MIKQKLSDGKNSDITDTDIMLWTMSQQINKFLHKKGVVRDNTIYVNRLDLVCDIKQELEKALDKTAEHIQKAKDEGKWIEE